MNNFSKNLIAKTGIRGFSFCSMTPALAGQRRQWAKDETSDTRLAAFIEATEMAENTTLLETDRLTAFRTFFTHKAVF